ncbi:hypothetical protein J3Q64DRAFT_1724720 [Phycomyces blakesleeanus]|uniref:DMAP1-binding domain-containing protein n=1 Tax=Phycomyces blakesleeanus TaxID=4837 RepID=A0ABR3B968_PHYBL
MAAESSRDLPPELLEKLRDLELELEDGDITQKGFEKKRTNLLEQYSAPEPSKTSSSGSVISQREDEDYDYGPEPSAADVVDFLDYLPSPTHSPTRSSRGAGYMEENFQQQQLERAASESSASYNNSNNNNYPRTHPSPTIPYRPYTQTSQPLQSLQQQPLQQQQIHYGQPIRQVEAPMGHPAQGPYYHPSAPGRPYDPRMAPRPSFPQNAGPPSPMRHSPNPYGYQPQPQTQQQQRPQPSPPSGGGYRPAPITHGGAYPPRPMYNTPRPTTGQQRPMYRPVPMNRPNGNYYRPTGHPNGANGAYQDNRQDPNMMYANPRSNYPYNGRPPVHGRQNSEFTTDSSDASMRQSYGRNDQSVEWGQ